MVRLLVTAANFADFSILKGQNTAIFGVPYRLLSTKLPAQARLSLHLAGAR